MNGNFKQTAAYEDAAARDTDVNSTRLNGQSVDGMPHANGTTRLNGQARVMQHAVSQALEQLWETLEGDQPSNLYDLVISEIERPLLETVMLRCEFNQSRAAQCLGINRSTLRKKLRAHNLIEG